MFGFGKKKKRQKRVAPSKLGFVRRTLFSKWTLLVGLVIVAWQGWSVIYPKPWAPDDLQAKVAQLACWDAAAGLPAPPPDMGQIAVLRLAGRDTDGLVTATLADCVQRDGRYDVLHETAMGNIKRELGIDEKPISALGDALERGADLGVSAVVFGEVTEFRRTRSRARILLNITLAVVETHEVLFEGTFEKTEPPVSDVMDGVRVVVEDAPVFQRIALWLAFAGILPLLCMPIIRRVLERDSNASNFTMLAVLVLADLVAAYLLCGFAMDGWGAFAVLMAAGALGAWYNYWLCSTVERLRK